MWVQPVCVDGKKKECTLPSLAYRRSTAQADIQKSQLHASENTILHPNHIQTQSFSQQDQTKRKGKMNKRKCEETGKIRFIEISERGKKKKKTFLLFFLARIIHIWHHKKKKKCMHAELGIIFFFQEHLVPRWN